MITRIKKYWCKARCLLIALCMFWLFLPPLQAQALSDSDSGTYGTLQWSVSDAILTISGTGEMEPAKNGAYPWKNCSYTEITVEEGVTSIAAYAFSGDTKPDFTTPVITSVSLPETLTAIGDGAFLRTPIQKITIPANVETIGKYPFQDCFRLEQITFLNDLETVRSDFFVGCDFLWGVQLPETVTVIEDSAFADSVCDMIEVNLPSHLEYIGANAFARYAVAIPLVLPDSVTTIYDNSFGVCGTIIIGAGLQEIRSSSDHSSLQDVDALEEIQVSEDNPYFTAKDGVLYNKDMTVILDVAPEHEFPDGVLTIPATVTEIRTPITSSNVKSFAVEDGNPVFSTENGILTDLTHTQLLQFPNGSAESTCTISAPFTEIGAYAFYKTPLQRITLSDSITAIGEYAFAYSDLTAVFLPDTLQTIGASAFFQTQMKTACIPASVTTIGSQAFNGEQYLSLTFLHTKIAVIDTFAEDLSNCGIFYGYLGSPIADLFPDRFQQLTTSKSSTCGTSLTWSMTGDTLTISGSGAMQERTADSYPWSSLQFTKVCFSGTNITIAANAFTAQDNLCVLDLTGVTEIGKAAFQDCTSLVYISGSDSVSWIDQDAFSGTPWLQYPDQHADTGTGIAVLGSVMINVDSTDGEVIIPNGITYVAANACKNANPRILYVPKNGVQYHETAFAGSHIEHVRWNGQTTDIPIGDFKNAGKLRKEIEVYDTSGKLTKAWGYTKDNSAMSLANALYNTPYMNTLIDSYCYNILISSHCNAGMADAGIINAIYQHVRQNTVYGYSYIENPYGDVKGKTGTWSFCNYFSNNAIGPVTAGVGVCSAYTELIEKMIEQVQQRNMSATLQTFRKTGANHVWNIIGLNVGTSSEKWYYLDATNGLFLVGYENPRLSNSAALFAYTNIPKNADGTYSITASGGKTIKLQGSDYVLQASDTTYNISSGGTPSRGDINGDKNIDANDAYLTLTAYAKQSVGTSTGFTNAQLSAMDVDQNGSINANDAYYILCYYTRHSVGTDCSWDTIIS